MIEVKNIQKSFKVYNKQPGLKGSIKGLFKKDWFEKHALKDISFQAERGEILGLIGSNGAGKTTLVKILSGIINASSGSVNVLGHNPWDRPNELRRKMALIMGQKAQLWWDLPANDCFSLLKEIYEIPTKQFNDRINFLSDKLEIKDQLNIQVRRLSLGERMKVELMASLLHNPEVIYLDEPTIGLDLTAQKAIRDFILEYNQEHSPVTMLTSHYMEDIQRLCKRVIIMKEGQFIYDGPLQDILDNYATEKIITFKLQADKVESFKKSDIPSELGSYQSLEGPLLKLKVKRAMVKESASVLLQKLPVLDLTIEEQDIADIIELIIREGIHA